MKIFVDCGGHNTCSIRKFIATTPDWYEYVIHSFEPNPNFFEHYQALPFVHHHKKAVWVEDTELPFYLSTVTDYGSGSTLLRDKRTGKLDVEHPVMTPCVDLSRWIRENLDSVDHLVLKMDIEGAEYPILRKMIQDGTISLVRELYVEFHYKHRVGVSRQEHFDLVCQLQDIGIRPKYWDALEYGSKKMVAHTNAIIAQHRPSDPVVKAS